MEPKHGSDGRRKPCASCSDCRPLLTLRRLHTALLEESGANEAVLVDPQQMPRHMAQMDSDMALVARERKRLLTGQRRVAAFLVAIALLVVTWPWIRAVLHL